MNRIAKGGFYTVGGLIGLLAITLAAVFGISSSRFGQVFDVEGIDLVIPSDSSALAYGNHLVHSRGCMDCHGENLGGQAFFDDPAMGKLYASNLTTGAGGAGAINSPADWDRAIRHAIGRDGRPLLFMPSYEYNHWSDEDVAAIVAYLYTVEPVDNELPANRIGPVARALYLKGDVPLVPAELIDHSVRERVAPEPGPTVAYGAYIAPACTGCHGPGYTGGAIPGVPPDWPPASNITLHETGIAGWTEADFTAALREGVRPDGSELQQPYMPVAVTKNLRDYELQALWAYLQTVDPAPAGGR
jgi:mono/diheme cytochrome c family protein